MTCTVITLSRDRQLLAGVHALAAQELEALGLSLIISLAVLASEILLVGMYLSAWRRGLSRKKLEPYLVLLYFLICCSIAVGFVSFYRGEASTVKLASQALVLISLFPNFVIIVILILSLGLHDLRTQEKGT